MVRSRFSSPRRFRTHRMPLGLSLVLSTLATTRGTFIRFQVRARFGDRTAVASFLRKFVNVLHDRADHLCAPHHVFFVCHVAYFPEKRGVTKDSSVQFLVDQVDLPLLLGS